MVRSTLLRGSFYGWLLHPSRGWSPVLLFRHTARWGSPHSSIVPYRGARVGPYRARSSMTLSIVGAAAGCAMGYSRVVCPMVVCSPVTSSVGPKPKIALGSTSEAALHSLIQRITTLELKLYDKCSYFLLTYRLELFCDVVKTLRLTRPAAVATLPLLSCACLMCAVGGSWATRPPSAGATSGRLWGLRTRVGAVSSSSSSSSTNRRSRWRLGTRLPEAEPWPVTGPGAAPTDPAPAWDDPTTIVLLPTTLSLVVGAGWLTSSSLLVYWQH